MVIFFAGMAVLAVWLLRNSLGKTALIHSNPKRSNMHPFVPVGVLAFWIICSVIGLAVSERVLAGKSEEIAILWKNVIQSVAVLVTIFLMIFIIRRSFARGLKGFGFNFRKLPKDIPMACLNLLGAWPIVAFMLISTDIAGKFFVGPDFDIEPHQELQVLKNYSHSFVVWVIFFNAAVVTSIFEEMLFRGFFQTAIRSIVAGPWTAIIASSLFFMVAHANAKHWPALFVLGVCMGYAYEKSGSMFRSIIIHSIFNGLAVLAVIFTA